MHVFEKDVTWPNVSSGILRYIGPKRNLGTATIGGLAGFARPARLQKLLEKGSVLLSSTYHIDPWQPSPKKDESKHYSP